MFEVVNYSWTVNDVSHHSRVWHADAQTASDTTGAANSPDSTSLLLSHLRISCDTRAVECLKAIFWQWRLFKTPGNLKKKCAGCFRVQCCNTDKGHKGVDTLKTDASSERSLLNTFVRFCGFAQEGKSMHHDARDNAETWRESAFLSAEKPVKLLRLKQ